MIVIFGFDGLEYEYVKEFNCINLMQKIFGKTDISEFTEPRSVVLWSSFLAGKNLEKKILKENLWEFKLAAEQTFFLRFKKWKAIDVPGFTYLNEKHKKQREKLKGFFDKKVTIDEYDRVAFGNYKDNKNEFFNSLKKKNEIVMGYFDLADAIGHLSFGMRSKMKIIYEELDDLVKQVKRKIKGETLILSDHGMKSIGRFGDHANYGFWSCHLKCRLRNPRITELFDIFIKKRARV